MNLEQTQTEKHRRTWRRLAAVGLVLAVAAVALTRISHFAQAQLLSSPSQSHACPGHCLDLIEDFEETPLAFWDLTPPQTGDLKEPYWHLVTTGSAWQQYHSASSAMYFGSPEGQIGGACPPHCTIYAGSLTFKGDPIYIPLTDTRAFMTFWSLENTEMSIPDNFTCYQQVTCSYDSRQVWISGTLDPGWVLKWDTRDNPTIENQWHSISIDISEYLDQSIRMRFVFDTIDERNNDTSQPGGWYVDDIRLYTFTPSSFIRLPVILKNKSP